MLSHVKQTDVSVPYRDGDWWYYSRTEEGLQYAIYCRKRGAQAGPDTDTAEEVLLDGNQLAQGHAFFAIGDTDITDDGRWLAYTTDTTGFRQYTLRIKDLTTGETLPGEVERVGSVVWAADNRTLFYTVEDEQQKRQFQLWRHCMEQPNQDVLVYQDDDERFNVGVGRTRDGKFIVVEAGSHTTNEARVLPADQPDGTFTVITPRED
jgi:oligopeptidase B